MRTASGATAVQVVESVGGQRRIVKHVGSAHTEAELGLLMEQARGFLDDPGQGQFDLGIEPLVPRGELLGPVGDLVLFARDRVICLVFAGQGFCCCYAAVVNAW